MRIAVTGMGIISAIGTSLEENLYHLKYGVTGITRSENLSTRHNGLLFGEVKFSNEHLARLLGLPADNNFSRTAMLGAYAAQQALENAAVKDINHSRTGLISASSVSGMDMTEKYLYDFKESAEHRKYIDSHHTGNVTHQIAGYIGVKGLVTTISTACSSSANAIMMGANLIRTGRLDRVVVGGTDALAKFTVNGFNSLMILTDGYNRPFDANRKGLNLGEGAAYLVLESETLLKKEDRPVLAYLAGYGNANDAYHQTASSETGEGAFLAMEKALALAGLEPGAISYVNAHGTATVNNDLSEARALERIFGNQMPDISSTKPFTGHTLAAAGSIEAIYSILAMKHQLVFPNLNFQTPMEEVAIQPQQTLKEKKIDFALSNSFGFGGNCSTLIFSKK
ncbi:beta-ketoacyl-[acyl-carrier-protein] synthase family protein [Polluticaenibacter yanchengensis]|uniref:Beta-ketoacyl-[acyl-carrier-protein] synthase family protein n=1 Tax=Polluticaenibacter yanchengensis TaxID=3014562 RepID=A0ABT4UM77_9BACT|nr:beta-ketoacyl-[acyl-carrier-protein] synthase family protein [Chitinophagaceae bacterium LY-5]